MQPNSDIAPLFFSPQFVVVNRNTDQRGSFFTDLRGYEYISVQKAVRQSAPNVSSTENCLPDLPLVSQVGKTVKLIRSVCKRLY
jgi:hypothetical protein